MPCRTQKTVYPVLEAEMAKRNIQKQQIAKSLGISMKAFSEKRNGNLGFWWSEVLILHSFFPDIPIEELMKKGQKNAAPDNSETAVV